MHSKPFESFKPFERDYGWNGLNCWNDLNRYR